MYEIVFIFKIEIKNRKKPENSPREYFMRGHLLKNDQKRPKNREDCIYLMIFLKFSIKFNKYKSFKSVILPHNSQHTHQHRTMFTRLRKKRSIEQTHVTSIATPLDDEKERTIDQLRKQLSKASDHVSCLHAEAITANNTVKNLQEETIALKNMLESGTETAKHDRASLAQEVSDLKALNYGLRTMVEQQHESLAESARAAVAMRSGEEERTQLALESAIAESEAQDRVITELGQELAAQKLSGYEKESHDAANLHDLAEHCTAMTLGMKQQHAGLLQQFAVKEATLADTIIRLDTSVSEVAALRAKGADAETHALNLMGERDAEWTRVLENSQRDSNANHTAQHQAHEVEKDNIKMRLKTKFETAYKIESDKAATAMKKLEEIKRFVNKI